MVVCCDDAGKGQSQSGEYLKADHDGDLSWAKDRVSTRAVCRLAPEFPISRCLWHNIKCPHTIGCLWVMSPTEQLTVLLATALSMIPNQADHRGISGTEIQTNENISSRNGWDEPINYFGSDGSNAYDSLQW